MPSVLQGERFKPLLPHRCCWHPLQRVYPPPLRSSFTLVSQQPLGRSQERHQAHPQGLQPSYYRVSPTSKTAQGSYMLMWTLQYSSWGPQLLPYRSPGSMVWRTTTRRDQCPSCNMGLTGWTRSGQATQQVFPRVSCQVSGQLQVAQRPLSLVFLPGHMPNRQHRSQRLMAARNPWISHFHRGCELLLQMLPSRNTWALLWVSVRSWRACKWS